MTTAVYTGLEGPFKCQQPTSYAELIPALAVGNDRGLVGLSEVKFSRCVSDKLPIKEPVRCGSTALAAALPPDK